MKFAVDSLDPLWMHGGFARASAGIFRGPFFALALLALAACQREAPPPRTDSPKRIITLTPSLTEIVSALGAADFLIATDRFSIEGGAAKGVPIVGDFLAPNVEAISKLGPELVILDAVQSKAAASLENAGLRTLSIEMHSIADVKSAVSVVARAIDRDDDGARVVARIDSELARVGSRATAGKRPRVLWVIDRDPSMLANVVAAGPGTYADELVRAVGGDNVLMDSRMRYPKLSAEAVSRLDFDIAIDASGSALQSMAAWESRGRSGFTAAPVSPSLAVPGPDVHAALRAVADIIDEHGRGHGAPE